MISSDIQNKFSGKDFVSSLDSYCRKFCDIANEGFTGCTCDSDMPHTTLPTVAIAAPAAGLVSVGVFIFFSSILGCVGP
jgi:hypothetical protein